MELNRLQKVQELKQDGKASLRSTAAGNVLLGNSKIFTTVCMSASDHKNSMSIDLGANHKFQEVGKFANTESSNNEDQLYVVLGKPGGISDSAARVREDVQRDATLAIPVIQRGPNRWTVTTN